MVEIILTMLVFMINMNAFLKRKFEIIAKHKNWSKNHLEGQKSLIRGKLMLTIISNFYIQQNRK